MECEAHYYVFYCDKEKMTEKVVMSQSNIQDKKYILQKNEKDECDYILKLVEQKRKIPDKSELRTDKLKAKQVFQNDSLLTVKSVEFVRRLKPND